MVVLVMRTHRNTEIAESDRDKGLTTRRLGVREFRGNMASFLRQARDGSTFLMRSWLKSIHRRSPSHLTVDRALCEEGSS